MESDDTHKTTYATDTCRDVGHVVDKRWSYKHSDVDLEITEDLFLNPDPHSPVVAISVRRVFCPSNRERSLSMNLVARPGEENKEAIAHIWAPGNPLIKWGMNFSGAPGSHRGMTHLGLINVWTLSIFDCASGYAVFGGADNPEAKKFAEFAADLRPASEVEAIQKLLRTILDTDLISTRPEIREEMVHVMKSALHTFRNTTSSLTYPPRNSAEQSR